MKKIILVLMLLAAALLTVSCGSSPAAENEGESRAESSSDMTISLDAVDASIVFDGDSVSVSPKTDAVFITGTTVTLKNPGKYTLSGTLSDGQIIVDTSKEHEVELVFNGVSLSCGTSAPVYIKSCDKTTITLADGTENTLTDASKYVFEDGATKPNACLYSKDDLTIAGGGSLNINASYNNGIASSNDVRIKGGIITVSAVNNAIKGGDSVSITGGKITITACDDGIKSDNETEAERGFVYIEDAEIDITADDDAIQAVTSVTVVSGSITVHAGGKTVNCDGDVNTADGVITEK